MQFRKRIRSQMYYGVAMLLFIVLALSAAGMHGALKFRKLTKDVRNWANELPLTAKLASQVSELRVVFQEIRGPQDFHSSLDAGVTPFSLASKFGLLLNETERAVDDYQHQLESTTPEWSVDITDSTAEQQSVARMRETLNRLYQRTRGTEWWVMDSDSRDEIKDDLVEFQESVGQLPAYTRKRMESFAEAARTEYHTWITLSVLMTVCAVLLLGMLMRRFHKRIFGPLESLVLGSRRVAGGEYDHRIEIATDDEVAELAEALNEMTSNFQSIKRELNHQVQQRTSEVVRSEQMASVGFLAAGVAHEINNPLASIAWSAESLEMRVHDILDPDSELDETNRDREVGELKKYLKRIQDEAFRCKGITAGLLDYSRLGEARKTPTDLASLIDGVIEIIKPLSRYRDKEIVLDCRRPLMAMVNQQEIKQVVLNLVTNALDSVDPGGAVMIQLDSDAGKARLTVSDNGCGMTDDIMKNIFKPFFTRRRDGQGTGLGLSITYRIIEEHDGTIVPFSDGPDRGSRFTVTLPLVHHDKIELRAA